MNENIFRRQVIPAGCFTLKPSAVLSRRQNVNKYMGDPLIYPYHDRLFAAWVERWQRLTPEEIVAWRLKGTLEKEIGYEGKISNIFKTNRALVSMLTKYLADYNPI